MQKPFFIGITGGSGSGKTTFIRDLRQTFTETELCVVSLDDYYLPRDKQKKDSQGIVNFDLPSCFDKKAIVNDIRKLRKGKSIHRMEYTFNNEKANPKMLTFRPAPIILIEGLFVFHFKKVRRMMDLNIFMHAKENLKVIRRIKRDRVERNYPLDDVLYRYENHVLPTYEKFISPYIDLSDIIINNNDSFARGLRVVKGFIKNHLRELDGK
ncbi:MAG: uridine kinase [Bacteroidota bacterium]